MALDRGFGRAEAAKMLGDPDFSLRTAAVDVDVCVIEFWLI